MTADVLYGLILAGGRSLRMGRDKAALMYHGMAQTQYMARLLEPYVQGVWVSVRQEQSKAAYIENMDIVTDHYASPSPLNGIVSAMRALPQASWLVVAVDMPHVDAHAIETLIQNRTQEAIATCFESPSKGGPDPLLAIWEGHGFMTLENLLKDHHEHVCPRSVLKSLPAHIIRGAVAPHVLDNVNTPEEWEQLKAKAS